MEELKKIKELYIKNRNAGCDSKESARDAVDEIFGANHTYINLNDYEEASHLFHKEYVLFFVGGIYKNI
jgi:hypothetical protein